MKNEALGLFISMLSLNTFNPEEISVLNEEIASCACSSNVILKSKAIEVAVKNRLIKKFVHALKISMVI